VIIPQLQEAREVPDVATVCLLVQMLGLSGIPRPVWLEEKYASLEQQPKPLGETQQQKQLASRIRKKLPKDVELQSSVLLDGFVLGLYLPGSKLNIEVDTRPFAARSHGRRDHARDQHLQSAHGLKTMRVKCKSSQEAFKPITQIIQEEGIQTQEAATGTPAKGKDTSESASKKRSRSQQEAPMESSIAPGPGPVPAPAKPAVADPLAFSKKQKTGDFKPLARLTAQDFPIPWKALLTNALHRDEPDWARMALWPDAPTHGNEWHLRPSKRTF